MCVFIVLISSIPVAFIVPNSSAESITSTKGSISNSSITATIVQVLQQLVLDSVGALAVPARFVVVRELPETNTGRNLKIF